MWMGKPCCDCNGDACPTGRLCVSTYNPYTNASATANMTMSPYSSGETPRCINVTFGDVSYPYEFTLTGDNVCAPRTISFDNTQFPPCQVLNTGIPLCKTTFYYEETYSSSGVVPCDSPQIAVISTCPSGGGMTVLGEGQSLGYLNATIAGSSISCIAPSYAPGTLRLESCFDEPVLGLVNFSGKTLGYQSPYDWLCICDEETDLCNTTADGYIEFYLRNCTESTLTNCGANNVTVEKTVHHSCEELWEYGCTKDADRNEYVGCCPDPITWTDSRFADYAEDTDCICAEYTLKASPCFTAADYNLVFNGTIPFSGQCENVFGQLGSCPSYATYLMEVNGPVDLINTGSPGSHTNVWNTSFNCCEVIDPLIDPLPYKMQLRFCTTGGITELDVQVCGRGYLPPDVGPCLCPELVCPSLFDIAYTETKTFSCVVVACDPIDIDVYDVHGNVIGSITQ